MSSVAKAKVCGIGLMKSCNKVGRYVDRKAVDLLCVAARGVLLSGDRIGVVCPSTVKFDRETILTRFGHNALFLDGVSSGIVDE
jgi:hypothetical protein